MALTVDRMIETTGTVRNRREFCYDRGDIRRKAVRATLVMEAGGRLLPVVWWDPAFAPPDGARVWIRGRLEKHRGALRLRAGETRVDATSVDHEGSLSSIASFYLACVEAEAVLQLRFRRNHTKHAEDAQHIVLEDTPSPLHQPLVLTEASPHHGWFRVRETAIGAPLLAGWPLVAGVDPKNRRGGLVLSPLLIAPVQLNGTDGTWTLHTLDSRVDLNPLALDHLGLIRESRDEVVAAINGNPAIEEAATPAERADALLAALEEEGIDGLGELDPEALSPVAESTGIHNAGVVMTTSAGAHITRSLVTDLAQIVNNPDMLLTGPAAVLLGQALPSEALPPEPHPIIRESSLRQDEAVQSAMVSDFTVVTGPPGTGKSQVLVNVVTAAVARGQTVLFASRNNSAVEVVAERLRSASPGSIVVHAGKAGEREEVADHIDRALKPASRDLDAGAGNEAWRKVETSLRPLYEQLREWTRLNAELANRRAGLAAILETLPPGTLRDADLRQLEVALGVACLALDAFRARLGWFGKRRRHRGRLADARHALRRVVDLLGTGGADIEACLVPVNGKPRRTKEPRRIFRPVEQVVEALQAAAGHRRRIDETRNSLSALPRKHDFDDRLHEHNDERIRAGCRLLGARWNEIRHEYPVALGKARELASCIRRMSHRDRGEEQDMNARRKAFQTVPDALPALPVWAVTNLSMRTNLPLQPGLFDLVVIDEASQCDVASALPVLVRGKRALIIGDGNQLVHIASLNPDRERLIALKSGLTDAQAHELSYIHTSCFAQAASRVPAGRPILLDLHFRSHAAIIGFSNEQFYEGRLELCSTATPPEALPAIEWIRVDGRSEREPNGRSRMNRMEAERVVKAIKRDLPIYRRNRCDVGVVTPFAAQARLIEELLRASLNDRECETLPVATAHRFQGDERDVMYFSPVVDRWLTEPEVRFAANRNLVNVALTRAKGRLVIVGDPEACRAHNNVLCDLANYAARLEESGFHSPLELALRDRLRDAGIKVQEDVKVDGYRLGLAVEHNGRRLDIEYDGAAFGTGEDTHADRDLAVQCECWSVMRFSPRDLSRDLDACLEKILERVVAH